MPCWVPPALRDVPETEAGLPTFIGSADPLRVDLLGRALKDDVDIVVRGTGWDGARESVEGRAAASRPIGERLANQRDLIRRHGVKAVLHKIGDRLRPPVRATVPLTKIAASPGDSSEYFQLTRCAPVTIGINRVPTLRASSRRPLAYSRLRDIEAPMLGACYLSEWTDGLARLYEIGTEIEAYRTADELADQLRSLRKSPSRRAELRARGQRRALDDHSIPRSLMRITQRLGMTAAA